jgi:DNA-binding transcriptional MerR regulator
MQAMSTREAAAQVGLSQDTVRWYEKIGLLGHIPRGSGGRRQFGEPELAWLTLLTRLRATGMPVAQMLQYAELVSSGSGEADRLLLLEQHRQRMNHLRAELDACTELLDTKITIYQSRLAAERS